MHTDIHNPNRRKTHKLNRRTMQPWTTDLPEKHRLVFQYGSVLYMNLLPKRALEISLERFLVNGKFVMFSLINEMSSLVMHFIDVQIHYRNKIDHWFVMMSQAQLRFCFTDSVPKSVECHCLKNAHNTRCAPPGVQLENQRWFQLWRLLSAHSPSIFAEPLHWFHFCFYWFGYFPWQQGLWVTLFGSMDKLSYG